MMWAGTLTVVKVEIHQVRLVSAFGNSSITDHSIQSPPLGFNELCSLRYGGSATTLLLHPMQLTIYKESRNGSASFFGVCLFRFEFCGMIIFKGLQVYNSMHLTLLRIQETTSQPALIAFCCILQSSVCFGVRGVHGQN